MRYLGLAQVVELEVQASVDEQERLMVELASGEMSRDELAAWLRDHLHAKA